MIDIKTAGIFAMGSTLGVLWGKLKSIFNSLRSLVIVKVDLFFPTSYAKHLWIAQNFFFPIIKDKKIILVDYMGYNEYNSIPETIIISPLFYNYKGFVLYKKKIPVFINLDDDNEIRFVSFFFLRFTININKLLEDIYDKYKQSHNLYVDRNSERFSIEHMGGTKNSLKKYRETDTIEEKEASSYKSDEKSDASKIRNIYWNVRGRHYMVFNKFRLYKILKGDWRKIEKIHQKTRDDLLEEKYNLYIPPEWNILIKDVKFWKENYELFIKNSVPHKRGCLLYGPPGSGKSMLVRYVADLLNIPVFVFHLNELDDYSFRNRFKNIGNEKGIFLIEDIDSIYDKRKNIHKNMLGNYVSFETLINEIDGVDKIASFYFIVTTNNPQKIDKALIDYNKEKQKAIITRPGRIDIAVKLDYLDEKGKDFILSHIMKDYFSKEEIQNKYKEIKNKKMVIADVVNYAIKNVVNKQYVGDLL